VFERKSLNLVQNGHAFVVQAQPQLGAVDLPCDAVLTISVTVSSVNGGNGMELSISVQRHKQQLALAARGVQVAEEFDLSLPVGLIKDGRTAVTTLGGLRSQLSTSAALSSPEIDRFLLLRAEHGFDRAFELCSADEEDGEAFCKAWDEAQSDLSAGVLVTVGDLVAMVSKARSGWLAKPRELLVIQVDGKRVEHALCPTPWFLS
jgi:hypothetical protein